MIVSKTRILLTIAFHRLMMQVVMAVVVKGLKLNGGMRDILRLQHFLYIMLCLAHAAHIANHDVRRESICGGAYRPYVHMMHSPDVVNGGDGIGYVVRADALGSAVERQLKALYEQAPRGDEDEQCDGNADKRVGDIPACGGDDQSRHHNTQ